MIYLVMRGMNIVAIANRAQDAHAVAELTDHIIAQEI